MTPSIPSNQVLFVAAHDDFTVKARHWLRDFASLQLIPSPPLDSLVEAVPPELQPKLLLLDGRGDAQKTLEWAQTLKMAFPVPLVIFYNAQSQLEFSVLKKNGADVLLHIDYDAEFIVDKLIELAPWDEGSSPPLALLNPVAIEDLTTEMELNFDLYIHLPSNQKSILVRHEGAPIDEKIIEKAKSTHQNLYFKKSQLKRFLEYSRTALTLRDSDVSVGITDKVLKTRQKIQEIISQFFDNQAVDFKAGKAILETCEKIIEDLEIKKWTTPEQAFQSIVHFSGRPRTFYNDVTTLCMMSAGLAYLLEKKTEEIYEVALAALLHNVGLAFMTHPILDPELTQMPEADKKEYLNYPEKSVNQVKGKKLPLPPSVTELILQHRENVGGGGFPKGTDSSHHHPLSRIIQFAYVLMQLSQLENDKPRHTLSGALEYLNDQMISGKSLVDGTSLLTIRKKVSSLKK